MSLESLCDGTDQLGWITASPARSAMNALNGNPVARMILKYRAWLIGPVQALLIFFALVIAWLLRFNFHLPDRALLLSAAPILIAIRLGAIYRCGLLHGWWRYTDIGDAVALLKAIALGSALFVFCMKVVLSNGAFPRAIYILEPLLSTLILGGVRLISRLFAESIDTETSACKDVILIGAGAGAERTLREITRPGSGYRALACVDDNRSKFGIKIHGVPVLGAVDELPGLAARFGIDEILIAVPSATDNQLLRFAEVCAQAKVRPRIVPSLREILNERVDASQFREVQLEDLLGRAPVEIDLEPVRKQIAGQTVLVTGAAGTIGSELCRQILECSPGRLLCLDRNETGIFYLQMDLSRLQKGTELVFCVTDFGDGARMRSLLAEHQPSMIFHAAAYKHVPMMEMNVHDAVKNNIFGLLALLDIAEENDCSSFVLISSDKAVKPTNIMGATKRIGELIISCRPAHSMRCVSVRFGNVLGSNGSVVPIFQKQLRDNQQLTITHPEVTRFFMTTREAVSLVLQAFAIGNHSDTLLLDMGKPICILDLAKALIRLSGKSEHEVGIRFIGLRAGEKLFEELSYPTEEICTTSSPKIRQIRGTPHRWGDLNRHLHQLRACISSKGAAAIRLKMKEIIPEYSTLAEERPVGDGAREGLEIPTGSGAFFPAASLR